MAYTVTASTPANLLTAQLNTGQTFGGKPVGSAAYNLPGTVAAFLHTGTGAGNVNVMAYDSGTLVAGTHLIDLTAVLDPYGTSKNLARVKSLLILNFATADGSVLLVGGAASNAWAAPFNGVATSKLVVPPGWADSANPTTTYPGWLFLGGGNLTALATSGTSKVIQLDSGAATITWGWALVGCDA